MRLEEGPCARHLLQEPSTHTWQSWESSTGRLAHINFPSEKAFTRDPSRGKERAPQTLRKNPNYSAPVLRSVSRRDCEEVLDLFASREFDWYQFGEEEMVAETQVIPSELVNLFYFLS